MSLGLLTDVADLYTLNFDKVLELDRIGAKSVENLKASIEGSKARPLGNLLFGLRIPEIGQVNGQTLAAAFGSMDAIMAASIEDIAAVDGFGQVIAEAVHAWFETDQARDLIGRLQAAGLTMEAAQVDRSKEQTLEGQAVVVSGTLEHFTAMAKEAILERGGKSPRSVSRRHSPSSWVPIPERRRSRKAEEAGVPILDEAGFVALRDGGVAGVIRAVCWDVGGVFTGALTTRSAGRRRAWAHPCAAVGSCFRRSRRQRGHPWHELVGRLSLREAWPLIEERIAAIGIDLSMRDIMRRMGADPFDRSIVHDTAAAFAEAGLTQAVVTNNVREFADMGDGRGWRRMVPWST